MVQPKAVIYALIRVHRCGQLLFACYVTQEIIKVLLTHSEVPKMQLWVQQAHFLYQCAKIPMLLALGKNWPCPELSLPHPPFLPSKQSKKKQCFLVFFIAGAIHLLFRLFYFLLTAHVPIVVLGNHVEQMLGTPNRRFQKLRHPNYLSWKGFRNIATPF